MKLFDPVLRFFEGWIDPFAPRENYHPPNTLLAYVWHYVGQVRWAFAALLFYGFANAVVEATVFSFIGQLVDLLTGFEQAGSKALGWSGLLEAHWRQLAFMVVVVAVLRAAVVTWGALIEEQVIVPGFFVLMRWQSHKQVISQSLSFFQNDLAGRIAQKVFQSGMATGDMMIGLLQVIWFIVVYAFTTAGVFAVLDWQLGLVVGVWIFVFLMIAVRYVPRVREHARITAETASSVNGRMVDGYANIQMVKLHDSERTEDDWVLEAMRIHRSALKKFTRTLTAMRVSLSVVNGVVITLIGWICIDLWLADETTLGGIAFVLALVLRLHLLSGRLLGTLNGFFRNVGITQNTMELVSRPVELNDAQGARPFLYKGGEIEFDRVGFHYGGNPEVIDDLSFSISPGEKVGLVGPLGAGKTTIVHLLMRFFDPASGTIRIDGQDISKVTQASLRQCFSLVQQDVQLFHRSVHENIAYGMPEATRSEVSEAARLAAADEFIERLEDGAGRKGYDCHVGERGVKLSGGQRQRIAIARAFLRDAPILVLDEATSQLDSEVEQAIQDNLLNLMKGKTVLVVAHRLSTISRLDRLIVLDQGKIVDQGSHEELIARNGLYSDLWARQSGGFVGTGTG